MRQTSLICTVSCFLLLSAAASGDDDGNGANVYVQHNLITDLSSGAARTDKTFMNPWGIEHSPTSPWWINVNGSGLSIVVDAAGNPAPASKPLRVTIPAPGGTGTSAPTGIVFNGTMDFQIGTAAPAIFLFATEDGTISGWNNTVDPNNAVIKVNNSPAAVYKGITLGQMSGHNVIYAANFRGGTVDVFDASFHPVTMSGTAFHDASLPTGFAPFNVQNIDGSIYVTFAMQDSFKHDDVPGPGMGYVDVFSENGTLMQRLEHGNWLNSPWAVVKAPGEFGKMSNRLLIGNFGSGQIAAYQVESGKFQTMPDGTDGKPLTIDGLWGLKFGNGALAGAENVLYFAAGINGEADGLFGTLTPAGNGQNDDNNGDDNDNGNGNSHGKGHGKGR